MVPRKLTPEGGAAAEDEGRHPGSGAWSDEGSRRGGMLPDTASETAPPQQPPPEGQKATGQGAVRRDSALRPFRYPFASDNNRPEPEGHGIG